MGITDEVFERHRLRVGCGRILTTQNRITCCSLNRNNCFLARISNVASQTEPLIGKLLREQTEFTQSNSFLMKYWIDAARAKNDHLWINHEELWCDKEFPRMLDSATRGSDTVG